MRWYLSRDAGVGATGVGDGGREFGTLGLGPSGDLEVVQLARLAQDLDGGVEEVVDCGMAHGADADALAGLQQLVDEVGAGVGLAGAGRTLDGDGALVELPDPATHVFQLVGEAAGCAGSGEPGDLAT